MSRLAAWAATFRPTWVLPVNMRKSLCVDDRRPEFLS